MRLFHLSFIDLATVASWGHLERFGIVIRIELVIVGVGESLLKIDGAGFVDAFVAEIAEGVGSFVVMSVCSQRRRISI